MGYRSCNHKSNDGRTAEIASDATYPAVAVDGSGRGVLAFTLVGADHYPSGAFVSLDSKIGAGDIQIAAEGVGTDDGFTGYNPKSAYGSRSRWGDYVAAVSDGSFLWIASEYIGQTCNAVAISRVHLQLRQYSQQSCQLGNANHQASALIQHLRV